MQKGCFLVLAEDVAVRKQNNTESKNSLWALFLTTRNKNPKEDSNGTFKKNWYNFSDEGRVGYTSLAFLQHA